MFPYLYVRCGHVLPQGNAAVQDFILKFENSLNAVLDRLSYGGDGEAAQPGACVCKLFAIARLSLHVRSAGGCGMQSIAAQAVNILAHPAHTASMRTRCMMAALCRCAHGSTLHAAVSRRGPCS